MQPADPRSRRNLLQFLLASPLLASSAWRAALAEDAPVSLIESVEQALNVFDFEAVAQRNLPPAHWGYLATGVDDDATIQANRDGFKKYALRVRRMIDISNIDMSVELFGRKYDSPIVLSPVSSQQAFHPDGEIGAAKAARKGNHLQIVSTLTSFPIEEVVAARGAGDVWYQLYPTDQFDVTAQVLKRVAAAGCPVIVLTVDLNAGSNRETLARGVRADQRDCTACHASRTGGTRMDAKPMFKGIDMTKVRRAYPYNMTWDFVKRMRDHFAGKILVKGIVTEEDGALAVGSGVDGIVVSNHGGRAEESGRGTIESLSEVIAGTKRKIPVIIDSGFRRGTDIFKALALGATAVGIGRPYIWGSAAFGEQGVDAVLKLLRAELLTVMRQAGTRSIREIDEKRLAVRG